MPAVSTRVVEAYQQTHVQSRSPLELVVMLYDGAIRHTREAREAIGQHDLPAKREAISRVLAILSELQSTLNISQGGELASSLDRLYTYVNGLLLQANMRSETGPLDEALQLLATLQDGWVQIATPPPAGARQDQP